MEPPGYPLEPEPTTSAEITPVRTGVVVGTPDEHRIAADGINSVDDAGETSHVEAARQPFDPRYPDDACVNRSTIFFTIDEGRAEGMVM